MTPPPPPPHRSPPTHPLTPTAHRPPPLPAGHRKMNPFCIPFAITNMGGAMLAMDTGFMGPNYSISTACATGNYCIMRWGAGPPRPHRARGGVCVSTLLRATHAARRPHHGMTLALPRVMMRQ